MLLACIVGFAVILCHQFWGAQIGELLDSHDVISSMARDSYACECPREITAKLVYAYGYYPPGTKFISRNSPLAEVVERVRWQSIALILLRLEKITHAGHAGNIDKWIDEYSDESTRSSYESFKEHRISNNLPIPSLSFEIQAISCVPAQLCQEKSVENEENEVTSNQ